MIETVSCRFPCNSTNLGQPDVGQWNGITQHIVAGCLDAHQRWGVQIAFEDGLEGRTGSFDFAHDKAYQIIKHVSQKYLPPKKCHICLADYIILLRTRGYEWAHSSAIHLAVHPKHIPAEWVRPLDLESETRKSHTPFLLQFLNSYPLVI